MQNNVRLSVYFDYRFRVNWVTRTRFLRVPEFAGSVFLELISDNDSHYPNFSKPELPDLN
jgi:hypothetical protein